MRTIFAWACLAMAQSGSVQSPKDADEMSALGDLLLAYSKAVSKPSAKALQKHVHSSRRLIQSTMSDDSPFIIPRGGIENTGGGLYGEKGKYAIIWKSAKPQYFELPTGGTARMWGADEGTNILYFAKKEQALALAANLKNNYKPSIKDSIVYRILDGEVTLLYPEDGVASEIANPGRIAVGMARGVCGGD
jgi:photosystem I subunit 2